MHWNSIVLEEVQSWFVLELTICLVEISLNQGKKNHYKEV